MKKTTLLLILPILVSCSFKYSYEVSPYEVFGVIDSNMNYISPLNSFVKLQMYNQEEFNEIKTEFNLLSEKLLQEKVESSTQTDPPTNTNNNKKPLSKKNSTRPSTASTTSKKKQNISNNTNVNITINRMAVETLAPTVSKENEKTTKTPKKTTTKSKK